MSQPAGTPAPAPATTPATPASGKPGGLSDAQWNSDAWDDDGVAAAENEDAELDEYLGEALDDDDAGDDADEDEGDWTDEDEVDEKPRRRARKRDADEDEDQDEDADTETRAKRKSAKAPAKDADKSKDTPAEAEKPADAAFTVRLGKDARELDAAKMARALGTTEAELAALPKGSAEKLYQKLWHAEQTQSEHTNGRETLRKLVEAMKTRPSDALQALGIDVVEFANRVMVDEYEERTATPEQKRVREERRELERLKAEQTQSNTTARQQREREASELSLRALHTEVDTSLRDAKLPVRDRLKQRVFMLMDRELLERRRSGSTEPPPPAKELIPALEAEVREDFRDFTSAMDGEQLAAFVGEDAVKKIRSHGVQKSLDKLGTQVRKSADDESPRRQRRTERRKQRVTYTQVLKDLKRR